VSGEDALENLKHPTVERTEAASNHAHGDEKWKNTAEIASHVSEAAPDEYGRQETTLRTNSSPRLVPSTLEKLQRRTDSDLRKNGAASAGTDSETTHVLLVEDNVINQRILKRKLEAKKFKVTTANNGREAVEAMQKYSGRRDHSEGDRSPLFDVILMDQEMPVLDGNAATKEIRKLESDGEVLRIPILGVTANVRDEQKNEMRSSGMDDVISKPYSIDDLIGRIIGLVKAKKEGNPSMMKSGDG
jgi:CheY-like chemotaxis protein